MLGSPALAAISLRAIAKELWPKWVWGLRRRRIVAGAEACQNLQWSDTPLKDNSTIIDLRQPGLVLDPLTKIAREGAQRMLAAALKAEADCFVEMFSHDRLPDIFYAFLRNSHKEHADNFVAGTANRCYP